MPSVSRPKAPIRAWSVAGISTIGGAVWAATAPAANRSATPAAQAMSLDLSMKAPVEFRRHAASRMDGCRRKLREITNF
jgi:hypothetical protein